MPPAPRHYESKSDYLARIGRGPKWLRARIAKNNHPKPVYLGGAVGLFDVAETNAWAEQHREERIVATPPQRRVPS